MPVDWIVCEEGGDFEYISSAGAVAQAGDRILVCPGTFSSIWNLAPGVTVESTGGSAVTFLTGAGEGWGEGDPCVEVVEDGVSIRGFTCIGYDVEVPCYPGTADSASPVGAIITGEDALLEDFVVFRGPDSSEFGVGVSLESAHGAILRDLNLEDAGVAISDTDDFTVERLECRLLSPQESCHVTTHQSTGTVRNARGLGPGPVEFCADWDAGSARGVALYDGSEVWVDNITVSSMPGGVCRASIRCEDSTLHVRNSILANNAGYGIYTENCTVDAEYNLAYGNAMGDFNIEGVTTPGPTDLNVDPLFTDPDNGDVTLAPGSPAIDAGDPDPAYNDLDGTRNDMGYTGGPTGW